MIENSQLKEQIRLVNDKILNLEKAVSGLKNENIKEAKVKDDIISNKDKQI